MQEIKDGDKAGVVGVSSKGRVLRRTGINEKKMAALDRLKEIQGGNIRPLDQFRVSRLDKNDLNLSNSFKYF